MKQSDSFKGDWRTEWKSSASEQMIDIGEHLVPTAVQLKKHLEMGELQNVSYISFKFRQLISQALIGSDDKENINFGDFLSDPSEVQIVNQAFSAFLYYRNSLEKINSDKITKGSSEAKILKLECNIPLNWDCNFDPVFIEASYAYKKDFIRGLQEVGQKHIFVYDSHSLTYITSASSISIDKNLFSNWLLKNKLALGSNLNFISDIGRDTDFEEKVRLDVTQYHTQSNTISAFQKIWNINQISGYKVRLAGYSHEDLRLYFKEKDILLLAPGPSLKNCISSLNFADNNPFITVALAQTCPALTQFDIKVDFIIVADPTDYSHVLTGYKYLDSTYLIADDSVHANFVKAGFKDIFTVVSPKENLGLAESFNVSPSLVGGSSVAIYSVNLAKSLEANSITMVGVDLSIAKDNYLVSGRLRVNNVSLVGGNIDVSKKNQKSEEVNIDHFLTGWNGEKLLTKLDYLLYHKQFEDFANNAKQISLYNCSEGGAFIAGFEHLPFSQRIKQLSGTYNELDLPSVSISDKAKRSEKFINNNLRNLEKIIRKLERILKILNKRSKLKEADLKKLDTIEGQLMVLASNAGNLSKFFKNTLNSFGRKLIYVTTLEENLVLSQEFYKEILQYLRYYKKNCEKVKKINNDVIN